MSVRVKLSLADIPQDYIVNCISHGEKSSLILQITLLVVEKKTVKVKHCGLTGKYR